MGTVTVTVPVGVTTGVGSSTAFSSGDRYTAFATHAGTPAQVAEAAVLLRLEMFFVAVVNAGALSCACPWIVSDVAPLSAV